MIRGGFKHIGDNNGDFIYIYIYIYIIHTYIHIYKLYCIHKPLNCNSKNTVNLIECNQCWKQYTGSSKTMFCYRGSNFKSTDHKFKNKKLVPKEALKQIEALNFP